MSTYHIHANQETGKAFFMRGIPGPVVMLNLLKFKDVADYSGSPELTPNDEISGKEAYTLYMQGVGPLLEAAGGEVLFRGKGGSFLIGPESESWDLVLVVKHASVQKFMAFAQDEAYLKIAGHRTAALQDSRLLPMEE